MNALNNEETPISRHFTRQTAQVWNTDNEESGEYDKLQDPISRRFTQQIAECWNPDNLQDPISRHFTRQITECWNPQDQDQTEDQDQEMKMLDSLMEKLSIEDLSESQRDARPSFVEEEYVKYFNKLHKISYNKEDVDKLYSLANKYNINTYYAIDYYCHCHACGFPLDNIGSSFCGTNCKKLFGVEANEERYDCAWGDSCRMCFEPEECRDCELKLEHEDRYLSLDNSVYCGDCIEKHDITCFVCQTQMFEKEGYVSGKHTYCYKCAIDVFDERTCNLELENKEQDVEMRANYVRDEKERDIRHKIFFASYDGNQDYFVWLEEQIKKHGEDPEFQKSLVMFHNKIGRAHV